mgnify:CR=1 FL=1
MAPTDKKDVEPLVFGSTSPVLAQGALRVKNTPREGRACYAISLLRHVPKTLNRPFLMCIGYIPCQVLALYPLSVRCVLTRFSFTNCAALGSSRSSRRSLGKAFSSPAPLLMADSPPSNPAKRGSGEPCAFVKPLRGLAVAISLATRRARTTNADALIFPIAIPLTIWQTMLSTPF